MKTLKYFIVLAFLMLSVVCKAQSPEGIIYQAEARNQNGKLISNETLNVKVAVLESSTNGPIVWQAIHKVVTNDYGMFVLVIGTGEPTGASAFADIDWERSSHFLNVKVKTVGTAEWIDMGTSQFLSVPYALYAKTAGTLVGTELKSGVPSQTWSLFGNSKTNPEKDFLGTTDATDLVLVTDNIERFRIQSNGDIQLKKSLEIGEDLNVKQNVYLNTLGGETVNNGPFTVKKNSPTLLTGTLDVVGNSNLMSNLNVNGNTYLGQNLTVEGPTNLNNTLDVNNGFNTHLTGDLNVDGKMNVKGNSTFSNVGISGTLDVSGKSTLADAAVGGKLDVTGVTTLNNKLSANGQVTINYYNPTGDEKVYNDYALRVEGSKHGIAIKSTMNTPTLKDNFITFFDSNGKAKGRIEGNPGTIQYLFDKIYKDLAPESGDKTKLKKDTLLNGATPAPSNELVKDVKLENYVDFKSNYAVDVYQTAISWTNAAIQFAVNCIGASVGAGIFGDIDDVVWSGVGLIAETINWTVFEVFNTDGLGVAFESGGADYAEWLEKKDINELLSFGEVVGVNGGLISKDFKRAEKYMVITRNPTIIGAMPDSTNAKKYEKVAFMGQVPVKVIGKVKKGDYIIPSGNQDGTAIAVSPQSMATGDYARIIGTAWGESDGKELFSYINTAVGINSNDLVRVIEEMQGMLNEMQMAIAEVNPNYTPQLYATNGKNIQAVGTITTSPSANTLLAHKSGALEAQTVEEAIQKIKDYAYDNNPNLDLNRFPYLKEMFENPTLETAQAMAEHYQEVLNKLIAMMPEANN